MTVYRSGICVYVKDGNHGCDDIRDNDVNRSPSVGKKPHSSLATPAPTFSVTCLYCFWRHHKIHRYYCWVRFIRRRRQVCHSSSLQPSTVYAQAQYKNVRRDLRGSTVVLSQRPRSDAYLPNPICSLRDKRLRQHCRRLRSLCDAPLASPRSMRHQQQTSRKCRLAARAETCGGCHRQLIER